MIEDFISNFFRGPLERIEKKIDALALKLDNQQKELLNIMATQADLDAALTQLGTIVTSLQTLVTSEDTSIVAAITDIQALLQQIANNPGGDFTTEVTALQSMASQLTANSTDIQTQTAALVAAVQPPVTPSAQVKK